MVYEFSAEGDGIFGGKHVFYYVGSLGVGSVEEDCGGFEGGETRSVREKEDEGVTLRGVGIRGKCLGGGGSLQPGERRSGRLGKGLVCYLRR